MRRTNRQEQRQRRATNETSSIYLGPMSSVCQHCQALRFANETLNCCHNGKVSLPPLTDYPSGLKELFTGDSVMANNFRTNIRKYNSAFSFASYGATIVPIPGQSPCLLPHSPKMN